MVFIELDQVKIEWNKGLLRIKKAEQLADNNPKLFDRYISEFKSICRNMSRLMEQYSKITGEDIKDYEFENGFKIKEVLQ